MAIEIIGWSPSAAPASGTIPSSQSRYRAGRACMRAPSAIILERRGSFRMRVRGWLVVVPIASALAGCGGDHAALLGTLERDRVELVAEAQEPIVVVAVREGEPVAAGQLLLRLD